MQSSIERERLMKTLHDEPANAWVVLAGCAAGLAIVVLLVAMVVRDERVMGGSAAQGAILPRAVTATVDAESHRKQVFDERRQRFQGNATQHAVASEAAGGSRPTAGDAAVSG